MTGKAGLGELERLVLLAVLRLGEGAYGVSIRDEIFGRTGRSVGPGTIYPTLDRLEAKGLVRSKLGEPTPERGGRGKRHFRLTAQGMAEASRAWRELSRLAEGLEGLLDPGREP